MATRFFTQFSLVFSPCSLPLSPKYFYVANLELSGKGNAI